MTCCLITGPKQFDNMNTHAEHVVCMCIRSCPCQYEKRTVSIKRNVGTLDAVHVPVCATPESDKIISYV
jgi:hypothetical protein